ncbi:MAG TPA: sodium:proton antiporter, partial [Nitrospiria bacterium]|nr:sodium:proton antiporter [Nitrospiria bacterium]
MLHAVSPLMLIPFVFLLGAIATAPQFIPRWWGRNYAYVSFLLGGGMILIYLKMGQLIRMEESFLEYLSFILLIGS